MSSEDSKTRKDTGYAPESWAFDEEVTRVFDDMLARSIPDFEQMRSTCFDLGCRFVQPKTDIVDLGCSRGGAIAELVARFGAANRFVGVESSSPMLAASRERFKGYLETGVVDLRKLDLRELYPPVRASLTLCVLTLQFVPIEYRQRIVQSIFDTTTSGGAVLLVEKVIGSTATIDDVFNWAYWGRKEKAGYSKEEIDRKRLALQGQLVPVTAAMNESMLSHAGFGDVECFWRCLNFAGWIGVKR